MRILHIATLVTPDGAYGGPIRVAINQAKALIQAGHDVVVYAGYSGFNERLPAEIDSVPVELFRAKRIIPKSGFAGLFAPGMIIRILATAKSFDFIHIHLARDLITLPAAEIVHLLNKKYVAQTHGMILESPKRAAKALDFFSTRRILRNAHNIFWLTLVEKVALATVVKSSATNLVQMVNGVPFATLSELRNDSKEVLFLGRLHSRKRPRIFAAAASELVSDGIEWVFSLVGPDEGEARCVTELISSSSHEDNIIWEGPRAPEETLERMRKAAFYVLPSIDEPFPMSVLEALSVGLPVIVTDTCGLAGVIAESKCGIVVDSSQEALVSAMRRLIENPALRNEMSVRATVVAREQFSMESITEKLLTSYCST